MGEMEKAKRHGGGKVSCCLLLSTILMMMMMATVTGFVFWLYYNQGQQLAELQSRVGELEHQYNPKNDTKDPVTVLLGPAGARRKRAVGLAGNNSPLNQFQCVQCPPGANGRDGRDGLPGLPGKDGLKGQDGKDGVSLVLVQQLLDQRVAGVEKQVVDLKSKKPAGAVYTHWGSQGCGSNAQTLYQGVAGGTYWNVSGGGSDYQCLSSSPSYLRRTNNITAEGTWIWGVEFNTPIGSKSLFKNTAMQDQNLGCAKCLAQGRTAQVMIPGRTTCPNSAWTTEYRGYLMTSGERFGHYRSSYVCVDENAQPVPGADKNEDGAVIYHVRGKCSGGQRAGKLPLCGPYVDGGEITCVVCTL